MQEFINPACRRRWLLRQFAGGALLVSTAAMPAARAAAKSTVRIANFAFAPTPLTIAAVTQVTWVNEDDIPHSIYCETLGLRSPPMDSNESFAHRFDQPGAYPYMCGLHPHMRGQVIVTG